MLPGVVAVLTHHAETMCVERGHQGLVVAARRFDVTRKGVFVFRVVFVVVGVVIIGLLHGKTVNAEALFGRVRPNHDEAIPPLTPYGSDELLGLVRGDTAVDFDGHRVLDVPTILEVVLLRQDNLAVNDVADTGVTPVLAAAGLDVGVEDRVE